MQNINILIKKQRNNNSSKWSNNLAYLKCLYTLIMVIISFYIIMRHIVNINRYL